MKKNSSYRGIWAKWTSSLILLVVSSILSVDLLFFSNDDDQLLQQFLSFPLKKNVRVIVGRYWSRVYEMMELELDTSASDNLERMTFTLIPDYAIYVNLKLH